MHTSSGELSVYIDDGVKRLNVWQLIGSEENQWKFAGIPVNRSTKAFKVIRKCAIAFSVGGGGIKENEHKKRAMGFDKVHHSLCRGGQHWHTLNTIDMSQMPLKTLEISFSSV